MEIPRELIESCKRGDPDAFETLVRETHGAVFSLVFRIVGNVEDAADVTQDVYVRVWRGLRSFRGDAQFGSWLYRVAANAALTHLKRSRKQADPVDPADLPEAAGPDRVQQADDAAALEQALQVLSPEQRAVVVMKDVYGMTCEEIGREVGSTEGAVKVRLFRARQRLADHLASTGVVVPMKKRKKSS